MKKDHIQIGGKNYRVEFNWNAITDFLEREELSLDMVDDLRTLKPSKITGLIYAGVCEGCRLDEQVFPFSKLEFGAMVTPPIVGELLLIYRRQVEYKPEKATDKPTEEAATGEPKKKRRSFFQWKSSKR